MGLMKKLTSAVVASSLVLGLVGTAAADFSPAGVNAAAARMQALNVVKGVLQPDGTTDLMLGKNITRAELVTIIVRAFGQSETAKIVKGYPAFTDTADHWASGEIAVAKNVIESKGHTLGVTATTFVPNKDVTAGEAIAFLMKFLGIKADSTQSWPMDYINGAVKAGLITEADKTALTVSPNTPATRGLVFYFADQAFGEYKTADGKNVYNTYVDTQAPVVTVDSYEANTTATEVTLTGTASGQSVLHVGSTQNIVTVGADGKWSTTVKLELGENDIWVHALDAAGNAGVPASAVKITRSAGAAATVEATVPATIVAGESFELTAKAFDANKAEVAGAEFEVTVEGNIGTYDAATGTFTAADAVGTGKLTIKSGDATTTVDLAVVAGALASVQASKTSAAKGEMVTLTAKDAKGNAITSGVTYTVDSADALVGANGVFIGSAQGNYTVTAKAGDLTATTKIGVYGATAKIAVSAPSEMVANLTVGASNAYSAGKLYEVTFSAVDSNGNVNAADDATTFALPASSSGLVFYNITSTGGTGAATTSAQVTDGVVKLKVGALSTAPGRSISFTADATGITDGTATVSTVFPVATSIALSDLPANVSTNAGGNFASATTITVKDQTGTTMAAGNYNATVTVTGPVSIDSTGTTSKTVALTNGSGSFTLVKTQGATGDITVTATVDGLGTASKSTKAVIAGPATQLKVSVTKVDDTAVTGAVAADGTNYEIKVQAVDAQGVATDFNNPANVNISFGTDFDTTGLTFGGTAYDTATKVLTLTSGAAEFTVNSSTFLGTLNVTASKTGYTSANGSIAFQSGAASKVKLAVNDGAVSVVKYSVPVANPNTTVSAQLTDGNGNKVAKAGVKLTFTAYEGTTATNAVTLNGTAQTVDAVTDANGVATVNVSARSLVNKTYTIKVAPHTTDSSATGITATTGYADQLTFSVTDRVVTTAEVTLLAAGTSDVANTVNPDSNTVNVKVVLKDQYGVAVSGQENYLKLDVAKILWSGSAMINNQETAGATYEFNEDGSTGTYWLVANGASGVGTKAAVTVAKAGLQSVGVKYSGIEAGLAASANVNVLTGAYKKITILENGTAIATKTVAAGSIAGPFTVQLTDNFGNAVSTAARTVKVSGPVRASSTGVDIASFSTGSSYQFYAAAAAAGTVTVTLTDDNGTAGNTADDITATLTITVQ